MIFENLKYLRFENNIIAIFQKKKSHNIERKKPQYLENRVIIHIKNYYEEKRNISRKNQFIQEEYFFKVDVLFQEFLKNNMRKTQYFENKVLI